MTLTDVQLKEAMPHTDHDLWYFMEKKYCKIANKH